MNISQIQENLKKVLGDLNRDEFVYDLLKAYGKPKASISRLKNGTYNLSKISDEILWKKEVFFKHTSSSNLHSTIDELRKNDLVAKHKPRFLIVTDFDLFLAIDTKTQETLDIPLDSLDKSFDFFLPWANMEKAQHQNENPADVKAAEKMARLYDEILKDNPTENKDELHKLNVFLSRLLFCFFAEDTEIFHKNAFTNSISSHTQDDGSDLDTYLKTLFGVLNTTQRDELPDYLKGFPYVNGGLFTSEVFTPRFSRQSRKLIIDCGELDWSAINPDIFGSMFQAVVHKEQRSEMGMHYTSVPNIMKVIEPLFMNELNEEFDKAYESNSKLEQLLLRLEKIRIFDPACGSGNFLIIAYKEIRFLEMRILQRINKISNNKTLRFSNISVSQFYGIELDDFAHEIAVLSLWLAEHQMNVKFKEIFGSTNPSLPLKKGGNILCENATRFDWGKACPHQSGYETYILGNPPYRGSRNQDEFHKEDMKYVFSKDYKSLDYVACWFIKAAEYIRIQPGKFSFVSTNSVCQGEQVSLIWQRVLKDDLEICFAHQSFKWVNNAKNNAGVTCCIIGVSQKNNLVKKIYNGNQCISVNHINGYLTNSTVSFISRRSTPLSTFLPKIVYGNLLNDDGNLTLDTNDLEMLLDKFPEAKKFIKRYIGSQEYIRGLQRWCLRIEDYDLDEAIRIPPIKERLDKVQIHRMNSTEKSTREMSKYPHRYYFSSYENSTAIIIPRTSSERRLYIPIGFVSSDYVISDAAQAIYGAEPFVFGIISSRMHMVWMRTVAGRLKTDYRYSSAIVYNNFPIPSLSKTQKESVTQHVFNVLNERELYSEKTLSELYDPDKMPISLLNAHQALDFAIENCYRSKPFANDEERLEHLFSLYEKMLEK